MLTGKVAIEAGAARGGGRIGAGAGTGGAEASLEGPGRAKEVEACLIGPRGTEGAGLIAKVDIKAEGGGRAEVERAGGAGCTTKVGTEVEAEGRAEVEGTKERLEGAEGATLTGKEDIKAEGGGGA
jgi:hypothetical protein